jgi:hypothetical protein
MRGRFRFSQLCEAKPAQGLGSIVARASPRDRLVSAAPAGHVSTMPIARRALPGLLTLLAMAGARPATAQRLADSATLLLPGPEGSPTALWASRVASGLMRGLPHAVALHSVSTGGPDGVTAANRFATTEGAEGRTLLVLPGAAAHARLVGESRARYPVEGWLPLCAAWGGAVMAGRAPLPASGLGRPIRLALPGPEAPEAAALLALDLVQIPAVPVFGLAGAAAEQALVRGEVDAIVLSGTAPLRQAAQLGAAPWCELDTPGRRDHPELPGLAASIAAPVARGAAQAGFAALRLRAAVVLPALTSADQVAVWRRAALRWQEEEARDMPETLALVGAEARNAMAALFPPPEGVLAYREWLLRRLNWQAN